MADVWGDEEVCRAVYQRAGRIEGSPTELDGKGQRTGRRRRMMDGLTLTRGKPSENSCQNHWGVYCLPSLHTCAGTNTYVASWMKQAGTLNGRPLCASTPRSTCRAPEPFIHPAPPAVCALWLMENSMSHCRSMCRISVNIFFVSHGQKMFEFRITSDSPGVCRQTSPQSVWKASRSLPFHPLHPFFALETSYAGKIVSKGRWGCVCVNKVRSFTTTTDYPHLPPAIHTHVILSLCHLPPFSLTVAPSSSRQGWAQAKRTLKLFTPDFWGLLILTRRRLDLTLMEEADMIRERGE